MQESEAHRYQCDCYKTSFTTEENLTKHISDGATYSNLTSNQEKWDDSLAQVCPLNNDMLSPKSGPFNCLFCGKSFNFKCKHDYHIRTHTKERPFRCPLCEKYFAQKSHLPAHIRTHTGERPFRCPYCENTFCRKETLTIHIRTHTGERPFRCPLCEKGFNQKPHLTRHILSHTQERPFQCPLCEKALSSKENLTIHIRTHTKERPFRCPHCEKAFSSKYMLTAHIRTHTQERPFRCPFCEKAFVYKSNLNTHIRIHQTKNHSNQSDQSEIISADKNSSNEYISHLSASELNLIEEILNSDCSIQNVISAVMEDDTIEYSSSDKWEEPNSNQLLSSYNFPGPSAQQQSNPWFFQP